MTPNPWLNRRVNGRTPGPDGWYCAHLRQPGLQARKHTMSAVHPCEVPANSLLRRYKDGKGYADCYVIEVAGLITQKDYVEAFYTSPLFKVERTILEYLASKPATDADAKELASGKAARFSAWRVEGQSDSELLLADFTGRTRSWLMAAPVAGSESTPRTILYFGSAVIPRKGQGTGDPSMGWVFNALLGFHRLYSRLLLAAASQRVGNA